ncbi:unnamed protein product [Diamesa serratosioi]
MILFKVLIVSLLITPLVVVITCNKIGPKEGQKSLIIIFDGTQSMEPDLVQLRHAIKKIVKEFSNFVENPIYNYILVVFRDPDYEQPISTKNPQEFINKLDEIEIIGGGDCPEQSLSALHAGIQYGLKKSIVYVLTDATAKDHRHIEKVLKLIQAKETTVYFLLTGDCEERDELGFKVYQKLARLSNGQIFNIESGGIDRVIFALRNSMKETYVSTRHRRSVLPGTSFMPFSVDFTVSDIDIRLTGEDAKLTIKNPLNEIITGEDLSLENVKIVIIKNPMIGRWTVLAESSSEYTLQIGSNSELLIEYGFSSLIPKRKGQTSVQPRKGSKNILTFFISDPTKIRYLSYASLVLDKVSVTVSKRKRRELITEEEVQLKLIKISDHVYATESFDIPIEMFKIQLNGADLNGNPIERLVSTILESVEPSAPEVSIVLMEKDGNIILKCIVSSFIPVNIQCQSDEYEITISQLNESINEIYVCKAVNQIGSDERKIVGGNLLDPEITQEFEEQTEEPEEDDILII